MKNSPKIAVVGIPGGWSSELLADAVADRTGTRMLIDPADICLDLVHQRVTCGSIDLTSLDGAIVKKVGPTYEPELLDRLEILHFLHMKGVRVFSRPASVMRLLDRLSCTVTLRLGGIPIPDTVVTENIDEAEAAVKRFGRAVVKPLFTSKARGMCVLEAGGDLRKSLEAFREQGHKIYYVQRMLHMPDGDLGVVFLGGEYLGCYRRVAAGDSWTTSTGHGGRYVSDTPSDDIIDLARKAQALFELDFTCVDVVITDDGPLVFEVSAFGGFRGLLESQNIDAAAAYADYALAQLERSS